MTKRGLGKGLDALLSSSSVRDKTHQTDNDIPLIELDINQLQAGKYQPRQHFSADSLEELSESIKAQGLIQPIVVRKIDNQKYEIIAGERRWRAAQLANLKKISCIIKQVDDNAAIAMALIENIQREDLNVIEEAQALERLQSEFKLTHQQIGDAVGKSRVAVSNIMRLNALNEEVKEFIIDKKLDMGHGRCLLSLNDKEQLNIAKKVIEKSLTVRETEQLVKSLSSPKQQKVKLSKSKEIEQLEQTLTQNLGSKVEINSGKQGKGKLVISYKNKDELSTILKRIH